MKSPELLQNFNELVDSFETRRGYIDKAKTQAKKFKPEVIEKVVRDHEAKATEISDRVLPLVPQIQAEIAALDESAESARNEKVGIDEQMEELDLRKSIGELEEDDFESSAGELRASQMDLEERLEQLNGDKDTLDTALQRWKSLASKAGIDAGERRDDKKKGKGFKADRNDTGSRFAGGGGEARSDRVERAEAKSDASAGRGNNLKPVRTLDYEAPVLDDEPIVDDLVGEERQTILGGMREDVSAVFEEKPAAAAAEAVEALGEDEVEPIAVAELEDDILVDEVSSSGVNWKMDNAPGGSSSTESEEQLVLEEPSSPNEFALELEPSGQGGSSAAEADSSEEPRRALLLYQEGTAEEQIYPFTGDVLTIGRGRDNDIQIKNDSKVSRFHCKLYRKGNNFYIEDNKSSNGSLVNGELITERRLFGGEELIIGETFFRFRIM
jgi:hypothetical protein